MEDFGHYRVIGRAASGSTATVYKARNLEIDRIAAIKDLHAELRSSPDFLAHFRAEAQLLAGFDDPHIVTVYDFVEEPARVWIAEEWVDGVTIDALLRATGSLTPEQSLGVLRGAMLGLAYAHDRGVVHGDLAPSNIIADSGGTSKLIDFGVSSPIGAGGPRGTPAFMSPEATRGEPTGKPSDVYAAGAILFLLLSGKPPFPGSSVEDVLRKHCEAQAPRLRGHGRALELLVADAMAKDPAVRPSDARAFLERLEQAARDEYGPAWLERASIAGLVVAVAGTTAASAASASGGSGAGQATTAFVPMAVSTGNRTKKLLLIGGGVAAVVAAGVGIAVAAGGSDPKPKPQAADTGIANAVATPVAAANAAPASSSPATSASSAPPVLATLPSSGKYRLTYSVVSTTYPGAKPGPQPARRWTLAMTCANGACRGKISSTSGSTFNATFDGHALSIVTTSSDAGPCVYRSGPKTGRVTPGTHYTRKYAIRWTFRVQQRASGPIPPAGTPLSLRGTAHITSPTESVSGHCKASGPHHSTEIGTLAYIP